MTQKASDYRSVAGSVHTQLVDARLNSGKPSQPVDRYTRSRFDAIKDLLQDGVRFSARSDGSLQRLTTPDKLTLARQLSRLAPKKLEEFSDEDEFDMKSWSDRAVNILDALRNGKTFSVEDERFIEVELEGFLENLLALPSEMPERFRGVQER